MKLLLTMLLIPLFCFGNPQRETQSVAKQSWTWPNGAKIAVSISYDDGLAEHLDLVVPSLDRHNLKGTFYLITAPHQSVVRTRSEEWRTKVAGNGHEVGNHSETHSCAGMEKLPGGKAYSAMNKDEVGYDVGMASVFLDNFIERAPRTFAYPCGITGIGPNSQDKDSYTQAVMQYNIAGRLAGGGPNNAKSIDFAHIAASTFTASGHTGTLPRYQGFLAKAEEVPENAGWAVFFFHGIGCEGNLYCENKDTHEQFLQMLEQGVKDKRYWVAPVRDVVAYIKSHQ